MCAVAMRPSTMDPEAPGSAVLQPTNDEPKALFLPGVRSAFTFFYSSNSPGVPLLTLLTHCVEWQLLVYMTFLPFLVVCSLGTRTSKYL